MDIITIGTLFASLFVMTAVTEAFIRAIRATLGHVLNIAKQLVVFTYESLKWLCIGFPVQLYGSFKRALFAIEKATQPRPVKSSMVKKVKSKNATSEPKNSTFVFTESHSFAEDSDLIDVSLFGKKCQITSDEIGIPTAIRWGIIASPVIR